MVGRQFAAFAEIVFGACFETVVKDRKRVLEAATLAQSPPAHAAGHFPTFRKRLAQDNVLAAVDAGAAEVPQTDADGRSELAFFPQAKMNIEAAVVKAAGKRVVEVGEYA